MDNALYYLALNRQMGLGREMNAVANNVANVDTPGYRREGLVFTEFIRRTGTGQSVSMADSGASFASERQGEMRVTGGPLDLAIEGAGFFLTEGPEGPLLTRAGAFQRSEQGLLVTSEGRRVLTAGGGDVFLPPGARIAVAPDGTLSVDGAIQARIGVVTAAPETLTRVGGTAFRPVEGFEALPDARIRQGALELSNVNPVDEIARMMRVGRAYEQAQTLISDEDDRVRDTIRKLGEAV